MGGKAHEVIASGHYDSDHFGSPNPKESLTSHLYVWDVEYDLTKRYSMKKKKKNGKSR